MSTKQSEKFETTIDVPKNVKLNLVKNMLKVEGPLGKAYKNFKKIPVDLKIQENKILVKAKGERKRDYAILNTASSLVKNLCEGVVSGYTVKMKVVYAHFPITVKTQGNKVLIENFQGERAPRLSQIHGSAKVSVKGDEVTITGAVLTDVTQTAADIQSNTKIKNKDHRVFLDGIYISSKAKGIEN